MIEFIDLYSLASDTVLGRGVGLSESALDDALSGPVGALLWDSAGEADLRRITEGLASTDFEEDTLREIIERDPIIEHWRVGEALAEAALVEGEHCEFPWPTGRDLKNPSASPAGADLVGFQQIKEDQDTPRYRFAFGEVKTSNQQAWPPSVTQGRHGLGQQLENLRDSGTTRGALIAYLAYHAALGAAWAERFRSATRGYIQAPRDIGLFGILVRDVEPRELDIRARVVSLAKGRPAGMAIKLLAIYIPSSAISALPERATRLRERRQ